MRNPAILYGVGNILENAVDFARDTVEVNAWWNAETVQIVISDDGPGIAPDLLKRIGEPYVSRRRARRTTRAAQRRARARRLHRPHPAGAHRRQGFLRNKVFPDHGAVVQIVWPRSRFEAVEMRRRNSRLRRWRGLAAAGRGLGAASASTYERDAICLETAGGSGERHPRTSDQTDRSLLIVEDDKPFLERLSRAMETRGFTVTSCDSVSDGLAHIGKSAPAFAVVDLRLGDGNGLDVVSALKRQRPDARAIVLTGYGNIATAVTAVKMGAVDYLSKPADADDVVAALLASGGDKSELPRIRCRPTGCAGSTSSASTRCATATSRKPPAASTCTAAPCSAFWPSARRASCASTLVIRVLGQSKSPRLAVPAQSSAHARFLRLEQGAPGVKLRA